MIIYCSGDLFSDDAYVLVNTVNTVGVMGKGVALAFKNHFPHNFDVYRKACQEGSLIIGKILAVPDSNLLSGNRMIVNLPTKVHWSNPSTYDYVKASLIALRNWLIENHISAVAMPAPGCGNGRLDWESVRPMIEHYLGDLPINIRVYT